MWLPSSSRLLLCYFGIDGPRTRRLDRSSTVPNGWLTYCRRLATAATVIAGSQALNRVVTSRNVPFFPTRLHPAHAEDMVGQPRAHHQLVARGSCILPVVSLVGSAWRAAYGIAVTA